MPDPQGLLSFPGLNQLLGWTFTYSTGVTPSVAQVEIAPQEDVPPDTGTMVISFGDVEIEFPNCAIDAASLTRDPNGMVVYVNIQDRRWAWKFGKIIGKYNVRKKDGTVDSATQKTPQELMELLLEAMNETSFDISGVPNTCFPEVAWDYANPAAELESLATALGCRVVLDLDSHVSVVPMGQGADLPDLQTIESVDFGVDPANRPDTILLVGGPTRFQHKFRLEAIGQELDETDGAGHLVIKTGEYKPIADLSYKPSAGWGGEFPPYFVNVTAPSGSSTPAKEVRARAQRDIYRLWRIRCTADKEADNEYTILGTDISVTDRWQVTPLERGLIATYFADDIETPIPPILEGKFWEAGLDGKVNDDFKAYKGSFDVDCERGIVRTSDPLFQLSSGSVTAAELYLTIAHCVKDPATLLPIRKTYEATVPGEETGTGPLVVRRDDLVHTVITNYDSTNGPQDTTANDDELQNEADFYIGAALDGLQTLQMAQLQYAGIVPISPDGAIQQVQWTGGLGGAITIASRNSEFSATVPPWKERAAAVLQRQQSAAARGVVKSAGQPGSAFYQANNGTTGFAMGAFTR